MSRGPTRDEVLILRCISLGDSSKIVSALSREWGKVRLVARGAKSPRSKLAGLLDPGNEVEALFYPRENRELWTLSDGSLRRSALTGASSLDKLSHLFAALELGDRLLPDLEGAAEYEPHFRRFLDLWHEGEDAEMASLFFALELRLLQEWGWGIEAHDCGQCGQPLLATSGESRVYWAAADGRMTCARCAGFGGRWIEPDVVRALAAVGAIGAWTTTGESGGEPPARILLDAGQRRGVGRILHEHMEFHLPRYRLPRSLYWLQEAAQKSTAEA